MLLGGSAWDVALGINVALNGGVPNNVALGRGQRRPRPADRPDIDPSFALAPNYATMEL